MANKLVIVESPSKAGTIKKFLGSNYKVVASNGHVRDLPKSQLGIDVENDFDPKYITIRGKGPMIADLKKEAKKVKDIYLATDPDREGEAISWHLKNILEPLGKNIKRVTFNEITKDAVKSSIKNSRDLDYDLIDAQQARRALDRIVGYKISPLLWKKIKKGLSAGRVQSAALNIIMRREEEILSFIPEEYWTYAVNVKNKTKKVLKINFFGKNGKSLKIKNEKELKEILKTIKDEYSIKEIKNGNRKKAPNLPFTTSTLQQEAFKQLGYTTKKTMMIAQRLYEGIKNGKEGTVGLITYMRTDSTRISEEAKSKTKAFIEENYGSEYHKVRADKKSKKSQDAHEAIRPTYVEKSPEAVKEYLKRDEFKLYKLIWSRFVASQMEDAIFETSQIKFDNEGYEFRTNGSKLKFEGFIKVYPYYEYKDELLPDLNEGEILTKVNDEQKQHFTMPPARYTEGSLVKTLEENGIGRPSTYATVITTLVARNYVTKEEKRLHPTEIGEIVNDVLEEYFLTLISVDFTAKMEEELDNIEEGKKPWKDLLREFYVEFRPDLEKAETEIEKIEIKDEVSDVKCDVCGEMMVIKQGKYGKFLACPAFPECRNTKPLREELGVKCPKCEGEILIKRSKKGRIYYGCEHNPECDFMSWDKPTDKKCDKCGEILYERGRKKVRVVCNNANCQNNANK